MQKSTTSSQPKSTTTLNKPFFETPPVLAKIVVDENQTFGTLFAYLEELPVVEYNTLQSQLKTIGQEADNIKGIDFIKKLQIPQLISRYKVFRTRLGIVRYAEVEKHTDSSFVNAMDDVIVSWNIFAEHYNRLAMELK
ncbi:MAG: hypothetical protein L7U61_00700 [Flavobacteriaceae bacterium]|jgi:hypothetical protein|nr:hypothetical protein [Flavobacteriaceae bacterium]